MNEKFDYIIDAFTKDGNNVNLEVDNLNVGCITSKSNNFNLDSEGNLTVKSIITKEGGSSSNIDFNSIYPVGSIYMSVNNVDPSILFGGTWEPIQERFLLGANDVYTGGSEGGAKEVQITIDNMPAHSHTHGQRILVWDANQQPVSSYTNWGYGSIQLYQFGKFQTNNTGGDQPLNIMPPYFAVYMWKRVS